MEYPWEIVDSRYGWWKKKKYIYNSYYSYLNFRDDLSNQFSEVVLYVGTKPTIVPRISQIEKTRG